MNNKDRKAYYKKYRESHKEKIQEYYATNREKLKALAKEYRIKNKEKINMYMKRRHKEDIHFRVANILRSRLRGAIKQNYRSGSAVKDLGCTVSELKQHLESKFQPGMTWDNYGTHGWHLDHIIPLSKFDLTNKEELLKACHYTNLQPLWAKDNIIKGNRIQHDML